MANMNERLSALERRMQFVEEQLGIEPYEINATVPLKHKTIKVEEEPEETINGFGKEQLRIMLSWAKSMRLDQLSKGDFEELRKWGMLKDFFPNAPDRYEDIIL